MPIYLSSMVHILDGDVRRIVGHEGPIGFSLVVTNIRVSTFPSEPSEIYHEISHVVVAALPLSKSRLRSGFYLKIRVLKVARSTPCLYTTHTHTHIQTQTCGIVNVRRMGRSFRSLTIAIVNSRTLITMDAAAVLNKGVYVCINLTIRVTQ